MKTIRKALLGIAFAATAAGALTGATFSGETKEIDVAAACATAAWPMIPAECLEGAPGQEVRFVSADDRLDAEAMQLRFNVAFQ